MVLGLVDRLFRVADPGFWEAMDQAAEPKQAAAVAAAAARDKSVIDDLMFHVCASRDERNCRYDCLFCPGPVTATGLWAWGQALIIGASRKDNGL